MPKTTDTAWAVYCDNDKEFMMFLDGRYYGGVKSIARAKLTDEKTATRVANMLNKRFGTRAGLTEYYIPRKRDDGSPYHVRSARAVKVTVTAEI